MSAVNDFNTDHVPTSSASPLLLSDRSPWLWFSFRRCRFSWQTRSCVRCSKFPSQFNRYEPGLVCCLLFLFALYPKIIPLVWAQLLPFHAAMLFLTNWLESTPQIYYHNCRNPRQPFCSVALQAVAYFIKVLDKIVNRDYVVVYLHTLSTEENQPALSFMKEIYSIIDNK